MFFTQVFLFLILQLKSSLQGVPQKFFVSQTRRFLKHAFKLQPNDCINTFQILCMENKHPCCGRQFIHLDLNIRRFKRNLICFHIVDQSYPRCEIFFILALTLKFPVLSIFSHFP